MPLIIRRRGRTSAFPVFAVLAIALARVSASDAGFDGIEAAFHAGYGRIQILSERNPSGSNESELGGQALARAHAFGVQARMGLGFAYQPRLRRASERFYSSWNADFSDLSLRLPFRQPGDDDGIRIGIMPLAGNPDAVLFGNYLARFLAYPLREGRATPPWDSLGIREPRVEAIRVSLGRKDGWARIEGWAINDGSELSGLAYLSGRLPRGLEWGLGAILYRATDAGEDRFLFMADSVPLLPFPTEGSRWDTVAIPHAVASFSARAALQIAPLLGKGPGDRFGSLFAEAALPGWKDYRPLYPHRVRRIIWMAGARLPTFGWLDDWVVQWERRPDAGEGSPYPPGYDSSAPRLRLPSPWVVGMLITRHLGAKWEAQFRALTYEDYGPALYGNQWPWVATPTREVRCLGRIVFRLR